MTARALLVGIGSPHGDDCVGWEIARQVANRCDDRLRVRCARTPAELLDWLEGIDTLDVCDALVAEPPVGSFRCWQWPADEIDRAPFRGSHDLSLPAVLALAETLGRLPRRVRIWGVEIDPDAAHRGLSPSVAAAVPSIVQQLCGVLLDA